MKWEFGDNKVVFFLAKKYCVLLPSTQLLSFIRRLADLQFNEKLNIEFISRMQKYTQNFRGADTLFSD